MDYGFIYIQITCLTLNSTHIYLLILYNRLVNIVNAKFIPKHQNNMLPTKRRKTNEGRCPLSDITNGTKLSQCSWIRLKTKSTLFLKYCMLISFICSWGIITTKAEIFQSNNSQIRTGCTWKILIQAGQQLSHTPRIQ